MGWDPANGHNLMLAMSALQVAVDDDLWETMIALGAQANTGRHPDFRALSGGYASPQWHGCGATRLEGMAFRHRPCHHEIQDRALATPAQERQPPPRDATARIGTPELANAIFERLEIFHNRQRRHSSLDMLTPVEFELRHVNTIARDQAS